MATSNLATCDAPPPSAGRRCSNWPSSSWPPPDSTACTAIVVHRSPWFSLFHACSCSTPPSSRATPADVQTSTSTRMRSPTKATLGACRCSWTPASVVGSLTSSIGSALVGEASGAEVGRMMCDSEKESLQSSPSLPTRVQSARTPHPLSQNDVVPLWAAERTPNDAYSRSHLSAAACGWPATRPRRWPALARAAECRTPTGVAQPADVRRHRLGRGRLRRRLRGARALDSPSTSAPASRRTRLRQPPPRTTTTQRAAACRRTP
eukprot:scaffold1320_cov326-Prasinococcus_capsulatus_cf.AAC.10